MMNISMDSGLCQPFPLTDEKVRAFAELRQSLLDCRFYNGRYCLRQDGGKDRKECSATEFCEYRAVI